MWSTFRRAGSALAFALFLQPGIVPVMQAPDPAILQKRAAEGERALAEKRYAEAEAAYEELRKLSPGTAEVHARLGLIYFQQGKFTEAVAPLREAMRLKAGLPNVDALLAMALSELGKYEEALPALVKAFARKDDPVLRRMAGLHLQRTYTGLGRDREAVEVALALSRLHPEDPEVLYHSSRLLANYAYLQTMKLAAVAPDSVWLHQAAGEVDESQGLFDAAVQEYRQVLALAPRRPGIHFRLGRALLGRSEGGSRSADVEEARKAFEQELRIDPTNANAAYELGEMFRKAADFQRARESFERALTHYPEFEHALVGLGRTLISLERPKDALLPLQAALKRNPQNEIAYYQLASAYRALGRAEEQQKALAEFTRLRAASSTRRVRVRQPGSDVTPQELDPRTEKEK
jgi:tetratricopeptide (TPR) repeat protein